MRCLHSPNLKQQHGAKTGTTPAFAFAEVNSVISKVKTDDSYDLKLTVTVLRTAVTPFCQHGVWNAGRSQAGGSAKFHWHGWHSGWASEK